MPVQPTYPGVYIEEIPSGVRTIVGVSTSVTAFVGFFERGPMNDPVRIFNFADFQRELGGLTARSEASYAIQQFFLNGGSEAWVVRTASGAFAPSSVEAQSAIGGATALTIRAIHPGEWGDRLRAVVDPVAGATDRFNLTVELTEVRDGDTVVLTSEAFPNLSMVETDPRFADRVVNDELTGSRLVMVEADGGTRPQPVGTISAALTDPLSLTETAPQLQVTIGAEGTRTAILAELPATPTPLGAVRGLLEAAIRAAEPASRAFAQASVSVVGGDRLRVLAGPTDGDATVTFAATGADATVGELGLDVGAAANVQSYRLGVGAAVGAQGASVSGDSGNPPDATALIGDRGAKTGIFALEDVDLFNILCIPRATLVSGPNALHTDAATARAQSAAIIAAANNYCEDRRAFFILDPPTDRDEVQEIQDWLAANAGFRRRNAAVYFPRVRIPDPLDDFRLRTVGASGTIAGLYARTDTDRGVWKAPAGTEAALRNVQALDYVLSDAENGALNPLAINALRNFPAFGNVAWGGRTLHGNDERASEWKYVPVRRLALFIEESLYRGTQWVVFEPNDEPLWAQIRLNVGAFMQNLFRQGAFQGSTAREAYLVKCDRETTTQNDIDRGIVNILVGFAPLKPAEFVIIQIQQLAGQIQA